MTTPVAAGAAGGASAGGMAKVAGLGGKNKINPMEFAQKLKGVSGNGSKGPDSDSMVDTVSNADVLSFARHILGKARDAAMKGMSAKGMHFGARQSSGIGVEQITGMFKKMLTAPVSADQGADQENSLDNSPSPSDYSSGPRP